MSARPTEVRTTLTTYVTGPVDWDRAPGVDVELAHVPVINILASPATVPVMPRHGITMHIGTQDIPLILQQQLVAAEERDQTLYEVQAIVKIGLTAPRGALQLKDLGNLQVLNLPRASPQTSEYLKELIGTQLTELFGDQTASLTIAEAVAHHPTLLDELAQHPTLSHIAVIVWESALPIGAYPEDYTLSEPLLRSAKLGTLYTRDPSRVELRSLSSEHVRPHLPEWVGDLRASAVAGSLRKLRGPSAT